jgi:hypothetical protein
MCRRNEPKNPCSATGIHLDLHPGFGQAYRTQTIIDRARQKRGSWKQSTRLKGSPDNKSERERCMYELLKKAVSQLGRPGGAESCLGVNKAMPELASRCSTIHV